MKWQPTLQRWLVLVLGLIWVPMAQAGVTTTPQIVAQTTAGALTCMRWIPIGMCFWLHCSWSGCSVRSSLKVGHYNPDLVVSSYNELGGNPWLEIRATLGFVQKTAATGLLGSLLSIPIDSAGNRTEGSSEPREHRNLVFRETDAIGHPLASLAGVVSGVGCSVSPTGVSLISGCETGHPSQPFRPRSLTTYKCPGRPALEPVYHFSSFAKHHYAIQ